MCIGPVLEAAHSVAEGSMTRIVTVMELIALMASFYGPSPALEGSGLHLACLSDPWSPYITTVT